MRQKGFCGLVGQELSVITPYYRSETHRMFKIQTVRITTVGLGLFKIPNNKLTLASPEHV